MANVTQKMEISKKAFQKYTVGISDIAYKLGKS